MPLPVMLPKDATHLHDLRSQPGVGGHLNTSVVHMSDHAEKHKKKVFFFLRLNVIRENHN